MYDPFNSANPFRRKSILSIPHIDEGIQSIIVWFVTISLFGESYNFFGWK
jgi:hypothetical protein